MAALCGEGTRDERPDLKRNHYDDGGYYGDGDDNDDDNDHSKYSTERYQLPCPSKDNRSCD